MWQSLGESALLFVRTALSVDWWGVVRAADLVAAGHALGRPKYVPQKMGSKLLVSELNLETLF